MNYSRTNKIWAISAILFYIGYCFIGYGAAGDTRNIFEYWIASATFFDGKNIIALLMCVLPHIKAAVEGHLIKKAKLQKSVI